ncbi:MAG: ComF family protein [Armatimonadetes bacterium]|nr:ComF family protein [Armatimonadota bacterium]
MSSESARHVLQALLDLIYPPRCEVCETLGPEVFCTRCLAEVLPHEPPECRLCGALLPRGPAVRDVCHECATTRRHYDGARSAGVHCATLRQAVIQFKFNNRRRLQVPLARLLADRLEAEPPGGLPLSQVDCLVPIPLHPRRRQWRGFDQALLITTELARMTGLPLVVGLARTRATTPQLQLKPQEREPNVRGAFAPLGRALEGKRILLIDDVYTTGATANQAAKAAKEGGAVAAYVLTISRPAPPWHPAAMALEPGDV